MKKILFLTIWMMLLITGQAFAATINAASYSYTDVKTAIDKTTFINALESNHTGIVNVYIVSDTPQTPTGLNILK